MSGAPFALVVLIALVWAVCLLVGTLGAADLHDEDDEAL